MSQFFCGSMHFPLHVAILLVVQGCAQFVTWEVAVYEVLLFTNGFTDFLNGIHSNMLEAPDLVTQVGDFLNASLALVPTTPRPAELDTLLATLANTTTEMEGATERNQTYFEIGSTMIAWILKAYDYDVESVDPEGLNKLITDTVATQFLYFFIAAGLTLVILGTLMLLEQRKGVVEYAAIAARWVLGLVLCLLTSLRAGGTNDEQAFLLSQWVLPTVLLAYLLGKHEDALDDIGYWAH